MTMRKNKWTRPALMLLVRGKPEERILSGCKQANDSHVYSNSDDGFASCESVDVCAICMDVMGS